MTTGYGERDVKAHWPEMFADVRCGFSLPVGWGPLLWALCEVIEREDVRVAQVKEKFGELRFYYDVSSSPRVGGAVSMAEWMSRSICEKCGTTRGVTTAGPNRITSLCSKCRVQGT